MIRSSEKLRTVVMGQNFTKKLVLLVTVILIMFVLYETPFQLSSTEKVVQERTDSDIHRATIDDIRAAYDPVVHQEKIQERLRIPCKPALPTREEAIKNPHNWSLSRYVSYYNIVNFLQGYLNNTSRKYIVQDFGLSAFFHPFSDRINLRRSQYPEIDIHHTPYESNSIDIIGADQVIEHILFPHAAVLELKRILKPGGIMILTTCAYNPIHATMNYPDFWRFLQDGLKLLSLPLDGGIKLCGGWGTKEVIALRAKLGLLSSAEKEAFNKLLPDAVSSNDVRDPFTTWIIMQK